MGVSYEAAVQAHGDILRRRARQFSRILRIPFEDVMQEASLALYRILPGYDAERGALAPFIDVRIRSYLRRLPNVRMHDDITTPIRDDIITECQHSDFQVLELADQIRLLQMRLLNRLGGREKTIWTLFATPSEKFQEFLDKGGNDEPTREAVASFLGLSLESVKWSLRSIRRQMTLILDGPDFSDLTASAIDRKVWPIVYVSHRQNDHEFVTSLLVRRGLAFTPTWRKQQTGVSVTRALESYPWGVVIYLTHGVRHATIVCEGSFCDDRDGRVGSESGYWRNVSDSLSWYRNARKALRAEA
jgi:DNA-directed RNA polymerase specialized sigma24 family protein